MKDGFNINEIEVIDKDKPKLETLLTGDVIKGLDPHSPVKPNSEIEKNEWIKFPDGTVQLVVGQKHETGGVKMNIPDGTKIISDNLTLTKDQVKFLKDAYGIKANTTDTYAKVVKTYSKEIGLDKLNQEQEEAFAALKKEMDSDNKEGTSKVNRQYLSGVINKLEKSKEPKRKDLADFFERVFTMQESTKKPESKEGEFKYGGISQRNFENLCKKHNLTTAQGLFMLENGGRLPMYEDAGEKDGEPALTEEEKKIVAEKWNGKAEDYLAYKKAAEAIKSNKDLRSDIYKNYQGVISDPTAYTGKDKGMTNWKSALETRDEEQVIQALLDQEERNARLKAYGFEPRETSQSRAKGSNVNKEAVDFINKHEGLRDLNFEKGYLSQASYLAYDQTMRSDKYAKNYGITQIGKADERGGTTISGIDNASTNTTLGQRLNYIPEPEKPTTEPAKEPAKDEKRPVGEEGEMTDKVKGLPKPNYPKYYFTPEQTPLPPSALEAEYMANIDLQRMDPMRIGTEAQKQAASDQLAFAARQTEGLPESQRAAVLASMLGTTQGGINEAILQTNIINQKNQADTELFNIGQAGQESLYAANNKMAYSDRAMQGKALQEEAVRNYYDRLNNISMNTIQNQQRTNLMDSLFPDVDLDFMGATVSANGQNPLSLEDRKYMYEMASIGLNPNA